MTERSWALAEGDEITAGLHALSLLGGGDRFEAYLAWSDDLFETVVAKVLRPHLVDDDRARADLERELEMLRSLAHPCLVRSFGSGATPRPHLVLEHYEGPNLRSLVKRYGAVPLEQLLPLALHVCAVLHYLSTEGIVHLDVKPRNIVMESPPKLIDLSIARTVASLEGHPGGMGTLPYMAPEQCDPGSWGRIGPPADIWGLGVTLHEAVTGSRTFPAEPGTPHTELSQLHQDPPPLARDLPAEVAELIGSCMARRPEERPAAGAVAAELEKLASAVKPRWNW